MDPERLGQLIDRHSAALELFARQWCEAPEDVVQEAFIRLSAQRRPPESPAAWLFRVVRNRAINAGKSARRRRHHEAKAAADAPSWFLPAEATRHADAIDPEAAELALRALPIDQREILIARLWGGLSFEQIAELSGSSSSTVHRRYQSGLNALRERLGVPCRNQNSRPIRP